MKDRHDLMRGTAILVAFGVGSLAGGCATTPRYTTADDAQFGVASYYGTEYQGRPTANGETFDMYDLTAAHNTLPFGTRVRVTNMRNGKKVIVRINDRGPLLKGRILDLSYGAATELDMIGPGTAPVRIEIIELGQGR